MRRGESHRAAWVGAACANAPYRHRLLGLLVDFNLLDALTNVLLAGNIDAASMRLIVGERARRIAGKSIFRALDHICPSALAATERRVVCRARSRTRFLIT